MKITLFGTQPYDRESFDRIRDTYGFDICYHRSHLNANNVALAQGSDAVCIFVNDTADAGTIRQLAGMGVKLIALRCAGFNNVDLNAAARYGIPVVRVPAYSPHAVAEHAVALMLALNRKIHRAYWRTRDGNFSLHGLMGFDMYGKTAGIVGHGQDRPRADPHSQGVRHGGRGQRSVSRSAVRRGGGHRLRARSTSFTPVRTSFRSTVR